MIRVREGSPVDADFIVDSQIQMAHETEDLQLNRETVTRGVAAVFNEPAKGKYYVAETDNQSVGCLLTVPEWSDWRNGTVLWIHSVYVSPKFRKQGVYKSLYAYLKKMVDEDPTLRGLRLYVEKNNERAQKVYQAQGMSKEHYDLYEWLL